MRVPSVSGNGSSVVFTRSFKPSKSMFGLGVAKWRLGGNLPVLEHEHRFHETGDAGGGFQVAEVRLHRADGQRRRRPGGRRTSASASACASIGSPTAVPVPCASTNPICDGAMPASMQASRDEPRLRLRARERDAVGVAVLVQRRADDHAVDRVAVGDRLREALQQHHARAFTADEAVGRSVERLALALRRKHRRLGKADETAGRDHHRHAAGERRVAASRPGCVRTPHAPP